MKLRNALCDQNFDCIYDSNEPSFICECLIESFNELSDTIIPEKTGRFNRHKHKREPRVNNETMSTIKSLDKLYLKFENCKSSK